MLASALSKLKSPKVGAFNEELSSSGGYSGTPVANCLIVLVERNDPS